MHKHSFPHRPEIYVSLIHNMSHFRSLQWLRGSNKNVELELDTIRTNIRNSRFNMDNNNMGNLSSISHNGLPMKYSFKSIVTNVKSVLKNVRLVRPVLITCGLMIFQRFTGGFFVWDRIFTRFFNTFFSLVQARILSDFMLSIYSDRRSPG